MTMQTVTQQLIALIPVIVGAFVALAGGGIKYWIDQTNSKKARRREKLERLLHLAYNVSAWSSSLDGRHAFGTGDEELPSPLGELRVIGAIYFPELSNEIKVLVFTALKYSGVVHQLGAERLGAGAIPDNANDKIREAYEPLSEAIHKLAEKAAELAKDLA